MSVEHIVRTFWNEYGRVYYQRFDYEGVEGADQVMASVLSLNLNFEFNGCR